MLRKSSEDELFPSIKYNSSNLQSIVRIEAFLEKYMKTISYLESVW